VRDGRAVATLSDEQHARLAYEIGVMKKDASRVFALEAVATEVPADRAPALLAAAGVGRQRDADPERRVFNVDAAPGAVLDQRLKPFADTPSIHAIDARVAARHTQLVTLRSVRSRSVVEDFHTVRGPDGAPRTIPVNGTIEEGILLAVRPIGEVGGLITIEASAVLSKILRAEEWRPPGAAGEAPPVTLPQVRLEPAAAYGTLTDGQTLLFVVPAPGTDGARVVFIRVRRWRP
jgi:hypothetical protein